MLRCLSPVSASRLMSKGAAQAPSHASINKSNTMVDLHHPEPDDIGVMYGSPEPPRRQRAEVLRLVRPRHPPQSGASRSATKWSGTDPRQVVKNKLRRPCKAESNRTSCMAMALQDGGFSISAQGRIVEKSGAGSHYDSQRLVRAGRTRNAFPQSHPYMTTRKS